MIELSVPLHTDWMGGLPTITYLDRLMSLGVHGVEIQLPPALTPAALEHWVALTQSAMERGCTIAIHAPLPADHPSWPQLVSWLQQIAAATPLILVVHGCAASQPQPTLISRSVSFARQLLAALPDSVTLAIEQGWNSALHHRPAATLRRAQRRWQQRRQRPTGVGSGMGAAQTAPPRSTRDSATIFDPALEPSWWRRWQRSGTFSAAASREATLEIVEQIDRPNCTIAWDLAHDWLGGTLAAPTPWRSIPSSTFLRRVGYVRLHDVTDDGHDHWPLVVGNVPYTSQLRALLAHGFDRQVCLAVRYPSAAQIYGDRWQTLDRSLAVARQALRLR